MSKRALDGADAERKQQQPEKRSKILDFFRPTPASPHPVTPASQMYAHWAAFEPEFADDDVDMAAAAASPDGGQAELAAILQPKTRAVLPVRLAPGVALKATQVEAIAHMREIEMCIKFHDKIVPVAGARHGIRGGVIQAKMGSGKTLMQLYTGLSEESETGNPTLIICNYTTMREYARAIAKMFHASEAPRFLLYHAEYVGESAYKAMRVGDLLNYDVVITTYDTVRVGCKDHGFETDVEERTPAGKLVSVTKREAHRAIEAQRIFKKRITGPGALFLVYWERVSIDESQTLRSMNTRKWTATMALAARYTWLFSGTPFVNEGADVYAQLCILGYTGATREEWKKKGKDLMLPSSHRNYNGHNLREVIKVIELQEELPQLTRHFVELALRPEETDVYRALLQITRTMIALVQDKESHTSYVYVLSMYTMLRQCVLAPYLIAKESKRKPRKDTEGLLTVGDATLQYYVLNPETAPTTTVVTERKKERPADDDEAEENSASGESVVLDTEEGQKAFAEIWQRLDTEEASVATLIADRDGPFGIGSTSCQAVHDTLVKIAAAPPAKGRPNKTIVFSVYVGYLDLLAHMIKTRLPTIKAVLVEGSLSMKQRNVLLDQFIEDPETTVLLMSTMVGGSGLNIQVANNVIFCETHYNDMVHEQAETRAHRPGQDRDVTVYELVRKGTIDEHIHSIRDRKHNQMEEFLGNTKKKPGRPSSMNKGAGLSLTMMKLILK